MYKKQPRVECIVCDCPLPKNKYGDEVVMPTYHKRCEKYAKVLLKGELLCLLQPQLLIIIVLG